MRDGQTVDGFNIPDTDPSALGGPADVEGFQAAEFSPSPVRLGVEGRVAPGTGTTAFAVRLGKRRRRLVPCRAAVRGNGVARRHGHLWLRPARSRRGGGRRAAR